MINVPTAIQNEILSEVGYPTINIEDIELKTLENLNQIIIFPSIREFFKWFPITDIQEYQVSSTFSIDFPSYDIFGVSDAHVNTAGFTARDATNPFVNNSIYRSVNSSNSYGGNSYGTLNDYDMRTARTFERMERQSTIEMNKAVNVSVDMLNRKITGYCNVTGRLIVSYIKFSEDFNKIPYQFIELVVNLSKANLLRHIALIRGSMTANLPNTFNYNLYLDRAKELYDETMNRFRKYSKVVIMRG